MRRSLYDWCMKDGRQDLLSEWDADRNLPLTPEGISYGSSRKKVWWRCGHGHSWQASPYSRTSGSGCPYCAGRRVEAGSTDLETCFPALVREWHPTKNPGLSPGTLSVGSHQRVWWRCEKGHAWQAIVKSRTSGSGCPYCANRLVIPGENDLASQHPELARQWDAAKNAPLTSDQVPAGSSKKVWWRCESGHSWQATIASRVRGCACPVCTGKAVIPGENDLTTAFPEIAAQWHPTKNGALTPENCTPASNRKVWWVCPLGHDYQAAVGARTVSGSDCPYCTGRKVLVGFNDLATREPAVAASWHPTLNGTLTPEDVTVGSRRKVWWQCAEGHSWKAVVYSRACAQKSGCPVCAGRVRQARYASVLGDAKQNRAVSRPAGARQDRE